MRTFRGAMSDRHETKPTLPGVLRPSNRCGAANCSEAAMVGMEGEDVAPGISCKWLAVDVEIEQHSRRLAPRPVMTDPGCGQSIREDQAADSSSYCSSRAWART